MQAERMIIKEFCVAIKRHKNKRMKSVLIIFPDEHLLYSPTVIQLSHALTRNFDVKVISFYSRHFGELKEPFVEYLQIPFIQKKFYGLVNKISLGVGLKVYSYFKKYQVRKFLTYHNFEHIIVTDPIALWMINGIKHPSLHLLSLELTHNTVNYRNKVDFKRLKSILIQSEERKQFLDPDFEQNVFYIQNAPAFVPELLNKPKPQRNQFIFSGTAFSWFGIFHCLNFLKENKDAKMTMIGKVPDAEKKIILQDYDELITEGRLNMITTYFETDQLIKEISKFRIGFCFYDFTFKHIDNINYKTAPSGKLFSYYVAGVPVIAINIPGLKSVEIFGAGVLIDDLNTNSIKRAVEIIEDNYEEMSQGCFNAARHFDFNAAVEPFILFLKSIDSTSK